MTGIGKRPAFTSYQYGEPGTKLGAGTFETSKNKRYYSSLDAEIYFSDYFVEDVVQIAYSVQQNNIPLFGYNSYVYDEVARGNRIIQGSFVINFTSPGYLFRLLDQIKKDIGVLSNEQAVAKSSEGIEDDLPENTPSIQSKGPLWDTTFDIDIMHGEENSVSKSVHVVLEGVVITGSSMQLDTSGNPLAEMYNFMARDIRTLE